MNDIVLAGHTLFEWGAFMIAICVMLALDLGVFHRKSHVVSPKEAGAWTAVWVAISMMFAAWIYFFMGDDPAARPEAAVNFLTAYVLEKSLAVDNIFVFILIFNYFKVPPQYQHRVLAWGVIGAILMRAVMIFIGAALISEFKWILYFFGAFLVFSGVKMLFSKGDENEGLDNNPVVKFAHKFFKITSEYDGQKFFTVKDGVKMATPLFLAVLVIEVSDLVFAVDSIPAVFAVTTDPFIVFTSNILAILGLRSMYFLLAAVLDRFIYLKYGLSLVLTYVGVKMLIVMFDIHINSLLSLGIVLGILATSIIASLIKTQKQ